MLEKYFVCDVSMIAADASLRDKEESQPLYILLSLLRQPSSDSSP